MAATENLATTGSKTAAATAAQNDINGHPGRQVAQAARAGGFSLPYGFSPVAGNVIDKLSDGAVAKRNQSIADAITGRGDWAVKPKQPFYTPQQKNGLTAAMLAAIMRPAGAPGWLNGSATSQPALPPQ